MWNDPDMSVLRLSRRAPPPLELAVFGSEWARWIAEAAEAAATPLDYVGANLLALASSLIGHSRWAQATPGWREPPHLWCAVVGDSGTNKSAAAAVLLRQVLPELERRALGDYPSRLAAWRTQAEDGKARIEQWQRDVREAQRKGETPPAYPKDAEPPQPMAPVLTMSDATIEKVASTLASASPKGVLVTRDEIVGWVTGMTVYNDSGRAFWLEAHGGYPYRVDRQKLAEPLMVPRLAVAVVGSVQPDRLVDLFKVPDDGLLGRFLWFWPDSIPFRLSRAAPRTEWATQALDRLRLLAMVPDGNGQPQPVNVPLSAEAMAMMERFGRMMQARQEEAGGLLRTAYGKARGMALRLSLALAFLRWCGRGDGTPPPGEIDAETFADAAATTGAYLLPMAERVFGDAAATLPERNATTLARWIIKTKPEAVHVRTLLREVRLPGLTNAEAVHEAAEVLVDADWLKPPPRSTFQRRARVAYAVNPTLLGRPR